MCQILLAHVQMDFRQPLGKVAVELKHLLSYLHERTAKSARVLFWAVIAWLSCAIDHSDEVNKSSNDPFHAPVLKGKKGRKRKISKAKKWKVAKLAARGKVFRSGSAVLKGMSVLDSGLDPGVDVDQEKVANKWVGALSYQYLHKLKSIFMFSRLRIPIISLSWDASRVSRMETLVSTIYNAGLDLAAWLPPQALVFLLLSL